MAELRLVLRLLRFRCGSGVQRQPTFANVAYGSHERQVLDFYRTVSEKPALVFNIHGGGWVSGDKKNMAGLEKYLAAGISVVSINYRYVTQAQLAGVKPPATAGAPLDSCRIQKTPAPRHPIRRVFGRAGVRAAVDQDSPIEHVTADDPPNFVRRGVHIATRR